MEKEESLDLLDLEDAGDVDALPEATPFSSARPKKPWLLMGLGIAIIVLATWIIVAKIGNDSGNSVNIDLDVPVEDTVRPEEQPVANLDVPAKPVEVAPQPVVVQPTEQPVVVVQPQPEPVAKPVVAQQPVSENGNPVRVVEDRKEVTFNPDKPVQEKTTVKKPAKKATAPVKKTTTASSTNGSIYVQFGSYSTRALAQAAEQKMRSSHSSLFSGKQFVILAAQVNGKTTYRLRVAFHNTNEANGFCRNAKSDGLDCYVTK